MSTTYQRRLAAGLCRKCGDTPEPGRLACRECLEIEVIKAQARRERRVQAGLCYGCCQPHPGPAQLCPACTDTIVARNRDRRAKIQLLS